MLDIRSALPDLRLVCASFSGPFLLLERVCLGLLVVVLLSNTGKGKKELGCCSTDCFSSLGTTDSLTNL